MKINQITELHEMGYQTVPKRSKMEMGVPSKLNY